MTNSVIYATKKGSAEVYAKAFAQKKNYPIYEHKQVLSEDLIDAEKIYYFASVYAGSLLGIEELKTKVPENSQLTILPVGLSSVNDHEKLAEIREGIVKVFPQAKIIHLRGRLNKEQLKLPEKLIIKMISKSSRKKAEQEKLDIEKAIEQVDTTGSVDYLDLAELANID